MGKISTIIAIAFSVPSILLIASAVYMVVRNERRIRRFEKEQQNSRIGATRLAEDLKKEVEEMKSE